MEGYGMARIYIVNLIPGTLPSDLQVTLVNSWRDAFSILAWMDYQHIHIGYDQEAYLGFRISITIS